MKKYGSWFLLAVMACLWGGIYDFTVAIYGICFAIGLFVVVKAKQTLQITGNYATLAMVLLLAGFVISMIFARDKGIAFLGVLRILVFFLFWVFWSNLNPETRESFWYKLTDIVAVLTVGAVFCYFIPGVKTYLFRAGRLGGVLQYSNTYAILLLILLIGLFYRKQKQNSKVPKWLSYVEAGIFIAGILWCGSRSAFVLLVIALLLLLVKKRKQIQWKWMLLPGICIVGAACISIFVLDYDIARLADLTLSSSTLNGRILYWRDALVQLGHHPAGLGYMGYYFMQPQFQTGNYTVKYVHNDILQFGLDGGWIALAGILLLFFGGILHKKNTEKNRLILVFLLLHVLFDFDLQYGLLFCILLMCADTDGAKVWKIKKADVYGISIAGMVVGAYFAIALGSSFAGNQQLATAMYPGNTFAWEEQMNEEQDAKAAEKIIQKNGMLASAYECEAVSWIPSGDYEKAADAVSEMLQRAGYQSDYYNQAVYELSYCLQAAVEANDMESAQDILNEIQSVPDLIKAKEKQATTFAWRINDSPKIELEESISKYIENLKDITLYE